MNIELKVSLDKTKNPWLVDIDETNNGNEVHQSPGLQTIKWLLDGDAAAGRITGFHWLANPIRNDIFGPFAIDLSGKFMTIHDTYDMEAKKGTFKYGLSIEVDGHIYSTTETGPRTRMVSSNPSIKNN